MDQGPIRPIPMFKNAEDFKITRNQPATIILPAYPSDGVRPAYVAIGIHRENADGTPAHTVETAPFQQPVAGRETQFELTLEEMSYIAGPNIKSVILGERYSAQSGEGAVSAPIKSQPYTVVD
ncbi:hypothetical protein CBI55_22280 [Pseudomonas syringae]|uniref:hypothetical protein n=1 Tax=Pseudomonas syringae TaxID=317 RepID=UPI000C1C8836|nr:hypothetical protein [Pseudomonas syringae]PIO91827.1 hypothetical protein CBI55_22280 [Pseudomonas syringae]POP69565.1 hypothetical protein CXB35_12610 [Pseudomonas syringae]POP83093.1 hypothetical protein CXB38_04365 [Pseudomonas syringae]